MFSLISKLLSRNEIRLGIVSVGYKGKKWRW